MGGSAAVAILAAVFILLGLVLLCWGRKEERDYYDAVARRPDAREFITRFPARPEPASLKIGGYISMVLGIVLSFLALAFWLAG